MLKIVKRSNLFILNRNLNLISTLNQRSSNSTDSKVNKETEFDVDEKTQSDTSNLNEFIPNIPEVEEVLEREENFRKYVEKLRDVSRFSKLTVGKKYRQELPTYSDPEIHLLKDEKFYRKLYSRHGKSSGIEVGVSWPNKQQLENLIKEENEYDLKLEKKIQILIDRKTNEKVAYEKLVKESDEALKKMPKNIENYYQRLLKKEKVEIEKKAKNREIMEQAREYYGYEVDVRDPRIQEMFKKFEEERKLKEKEKKKEDEKKKLQQQNYKFKTVTKIDKDIKNI